MYLVVQKLYYNDLNMRKYSRNEVLNIKKLRKDGYSISDLVKLSKMPKTTIWHHIKDISLTANQKKELLSRQRSGIKRSQLSWDKAREEALKLLSTKNNNTLLVIVAASLYWAEGSKRELVFTNTDYRMINIFLHLLKNVFDFSEEDINLLIRISDPIVPGVALKYWKSMTKLPYKNISINHNNLQNRTKTKYGICRITVKKGGFKLKVIHCMIENLSKQILPS